MNQTGYRDGFYAGFMKVAMEKQAYGAAVIAMNALASGAKNFQKFIKSPTIMKLRSKAAPAAIKAVDPSAEVSALSRIAKRSGGAVQDWMNPVTWGRAGLTSGVTGKKLHPLTNHFLNRAGAAEALSDYEAGRRIGQYFRAQGITDPKQAAIEAFNRFRTLNAEQRKFYTQNPHLINLTTALKEEGMSAPGGDVLHMLESGEFPIPFTSLKTKKILNPPVPADYVPSLWDKTMTTGLDTSLALGLGPGGVALTEAKKRALASPTIAKGTEKFIGKGRTSTAKQVGTELLASPYLPDIAIRDKYINQVFSRQ